MIKESISTLVSGNSLSFEEASGAMEEIMSGKATGDTRVAGWEKIRKGGTKRVRINK